MYGIVLFCSPGASIQKLTDVSIPTNASLSPQSLQAEKTAMVRAARQLLSAVTKVLILADKVVVKQLITSKDRVGGTGWWCLNPLTPKPPQNIKKKIGQVLKG